MRVWLIYQLYLRTWGHRLRHRQQRTTKSWIITEQIHDVKWKYLVCFVNNLIKYLFTADQDTKNQYVNYLRSQGITVEIIGVYDESDDAAEEDYPTYESHVNPHRSMILRWMKITFPLRQDIVLCATVSICAVRSVGMASERWTTVWSTAYQLS